MTERTRLERLNAAKADVDYKFGLLSECLSEVERLVAERYALTAELDKRLARHTAALDTAQQALDVAMTRLAKS